MNNLAPPPKLDRDHTVFINCPFDDDYRDFRQALTLAVIASGYGPVCGYDNIDHNVPRIYRITNFIAKSRYSIHDCTRCHGEGPENLARFNMPLELGMALMESHNREHDFMVLVPDNHSYKRFLSDLAGHDFFSYRAESHYIMGRVLRWLRDRENCVLKPTLRQVEAVWQIFLEKRERAKRDFDDSEDLPQDVLLSMFYHICSKQRWWREPP